MGQEVSLDALVVEGELSRVRSSVRWCWWIGSARKSGGVVADAGWRVRWAEGRRHG